MNGGEIIGQTLEQAGVAHVFTLCGGHISPVLVGCKNAGIRVIDVRHEANAVFAADATARITGIPGVAVYTAGPGVTNTITAVMNARMAQSPLVLMGGAAATVIKGRGSLQDVDQIPLLKKIVKLAVSVKRNCDLVPAIEKAFQVAATGVPGPVFIELPIDLLYDEDLVRHWYGVSSSVSGKRGIKSRLFSLYLYHHVNKMFACDLEDVESGKYSISRKKIPAGKVKKAACKIAHAEKPVMIIGSQALVRPGKSNLLVAAVKKLGMPVFLTGMARGLL